MFCCCPILLNFLRVFPVWTWLMVPGGLVWGFRKSIAYFFGQAFWHLDWPQKGKLVDWSTSRFWRSARQGPRVIYDCLLCRVPIQEDVADLFAFPHVPGSRARSFHQGLSSLKCPLFLMFIWFYLRCFFMFQILFQEWFGMISCLQTPLLQSYQGLSTLIPRWFHRCSISAFQVLRIKTLGASGGEAQASSAQGR